MPFFPSAKNLNKNPIIFRKKQRQINLCCRLTINSMLYYKNKLASLSENLYIMRKLWNRNTAILQNAFETFDLCQKLLPLISCLFSSNYFPSRKEIYKNKNSNIEQYILESKGLN
jgi:hypothetical protein